MLLRSYQCFSWLRLNYGDREQNHHSPSETVAAPMIWIFFSRNIKFFGIPMDWESKQAHKSSRVFLWGGKKKKEKRARERENFFLKISGLFQVINVILLQFLHFHDPTLTLCVIDLFCSVERGGFMDSGKESDSAADTPTSWVFLRCFPFVWLLRMVEKGKEREFFWVWFCYVIVIMLWEEKKNEQKRMNWIEFHQSWFMCQKP